MILPGGGVDDDIIKVGGELVMGAQDNVHYSLECFWNPMEAKGEDPLVPILLAAQKAVFCPA